MSYRWDGQSALCIDEGIGCSKGATIEGRTVADASQGPCTPTREHRQGLATPRKHLPFRVQLPPLVNLCVGKVTHMIDLSMYDAAGPRVVLQPRSILTKGIEFCFAAEVRQSLSILLLS